MLRLPVVSQRIARQISHRCFATGTVKFYNRAHLYGFIKGDGIAGDIFVQHSKIACAAGTTLREKNIPFLLQRERVSFDLVVNEEGKNEAHNVKFEDGTFVPHWREKYKKHLISHIKSSMGIQVYNILYDEQMDEGKKVTLVMEEYENAKRGIEDIQKKARQEAETLAAVGYAEQDTPSQTEHEEKEEEAVEDDAGQDNPIQTAHEEKEEAVEDDSKVTL
jgi:cold shock CspA family protein